jgi:hypothetical protein
MCGVMQWWIVLSITLDVFDSLEFFLLRTRYIQGTVDISKLATIAVSPSPGSPGTYTCGRVFFWNLGVVLGSNFHCCCYCSISCLSNIEEPSSIVVSRLQYNRQRPLSVMVSFFAVIVSFSEANFGCHWLSRAPMTSTSVVIGGSRLRRAHRTNTGLLLSVDQKSSTLVSFSRPSTN